MEEQAAAQAGAAAASSAQARTFVRRSNENNLALETLARCAAGKHHQRSSSQVLCLFLAVKSFFYDNGRTESQSLVSKEHMKNQIPALCIAAAEPGERNAAMQRRSHVWYHKKSLNSGNKSGEEKMR